MKRFVCCLLALGTLFLGGCGKSGDRVEVTDAVCPYVIQSQRDGSLQVQVDTAALPGYEWQHDMVWKDVCQVAVEQQEAGAVLTLTGLKEGLEEITLRYMRGGDDPEYRFAVTLQVSVDGENRVQLQYFNHQTLSGNGAGGEETAYPYRWSTDEAGKVTFAVSCEDSDLWSVVEGETAACAVEGLVYGMEEFMLYITPQTEGEDTLLLEHDSTGEQLLLGISVNSDLVTAVRLEAADNG